MKKQIEGHEYDNIKTAKELIRKVAINGISTNIDDQSRAQDILGHSTIDELNELANSSEQVANKSESSLFYFTIQHLWNIEDVIRFWNNNSNPEHREVERLRKEVKRQEEKLTQTAAAYESLLSDYGKLKNELKQLQAESSKDAQKILELKARLFDLMEQGAA